MITSTIRYFRCRQHALYFSARDNNLPEEKTHRIQYGQINTQPMLQKTIRSQTFTFQYVQINTTPSACVSIFICSFTFQYVQINTHQSLSCAFQNHKSFTFQYDQINTPGSEVHRLRVFVFTFQYVQINTYLRSRRYRLYSLPLHSNMFRLIPDL